MCVNFILFFDRTQVTLTVDVNVMFKRPQLTSEPTWQQIQEYYNKNGNKLIIKDLFANDRNRFNKFR